MIATLRPGLLLAAALAVASGSALAAEGAPTVEVQLLADTAAVGGGDRFDLVVHFAIEPGWHIYWENPGDTGMATTARLDGPAGYQLDRLRFPGPTRYHDEGTRFLTYGYAEGTALFVEVEAPEEVEAPARFTADVRWLACHTDDGRCVFQTAQAELELPVRTGEVRTANVELLAAHRKRLPLRLRANPSSVDTERGFDVTLILPGPGPVRLYPTLPFEDYLIGFEPRTDGSSARLELRRPARDPVVVRPVFELGDGSFVTVDIEVEPSAPPPPPAPPAEPPEGETQ